MTEKLTLRDKDLSDSSFAMVNLEGWWWGADEQGFP